MIREDHSAEVEAFFAEFERASDDEAWDRYGEMFLETFLNMDPTSSGPLARETLLAFLPHRKAVLDRAGASGARLATLRIEHLDDRHVLAHTTWDVLFTHEHTPVQLETTFLLRHEDRWRIAVYLNHASLLDLLASRG